MFDIKQYFVYALIDECKIIRYIGKCGEGPKRIKSHFNKSTNPIVRKNMNERWSWKYLFTCSDELHTLKMESILIKEHADTVYNICRSGGITRCQRRGSPISIKNIETGEILNFDQQLHAAKYLGCSGSYVNRLACGEHAIILKKWILSHVDPTSIIIKKRKPIRKKGYSLEKSYKPMIIYDNHSKEYLQFNSRKACSKHTRVTNGDISSLAKGKLMSVSNGRFSLQPLEKIDKSVTVYDLQTNQNIHFESQAEFSKQLDIPNYGICGLIKGRIKVLSGRYILPDNVTSFQEKLPIQVFDLHANEVLTFNTKAEMGRQYDFTISEICALFKKRKNTLGKRFIRVEDAPTEFLAV